MVPFGRKQYVAEELSQEGLKEGCREQPGTKRALFECNYPASILILADVLVKLSYDSFVLGVVGQTYPKDREFAARNSNIAKYSKGLAHKNLFANIG